MSKLEQVKLQAILMWVRKFHNWDIHYDQVTKTYFTGGK